MRLIAGSDGERYAHTTSCPIRRTVRRCWSMVRASDATDDIWSGSLAQSAGYRAGGCRFIFGYRLSDLVDGIWLVCQRDFCGVIYVTVTCIICPTFDLNFISLSKCRSPCYGPVCTQSTLILALGAEDEETHSQRVSSATAIWIGESSDGIRVDSAGCRSISFSSLPTSLLYFLSNLPCGLAYIFIHLYLSEYLPIIILNLSWQSGIVYLHRSYRHLPMFELELPASAC